MSQEFPDYIVLSVVRIHHWFGTVTSTGLKLKLHTGTASGITDLGHLPQEVPCFASAYVDGKVR